MVGDIGGGQPAPLALGDTPNVAARLQRYAAPDTVIISEAVYHLIHGYFLCQDLGQPTLKGVTTPVAVYRVLGVSAAQNRLDVEATRGLTPLVGRESEVRLLLARWEQVQEGRGQSVLVSGEAGIGKSRLLQVLQERVGDTAWTRMECRCSPYHQHSALYPVIAHLQRALGWERDDSADTKLRKLEGALAPHAMALPEVVPLLAMLLSVPLPARYPPLTLTPERQKHKTLEAVLAWLLKEAERQSVCLVMEDLHWVDPSTLEWLDLLIDQIPTARVLLLLIFRPEFRPPWAVHSHITHLALGRLSNRQTEEMIGHLARGKPLPAEVVQQVVATTDGVPLFVEELTKMVLESGLVTEREGRYALTGPLPPLAIPATLHDALVARLDRLGSAKQVAQLGAVVGREFTYEVLQAVAPLEEDMLQQGLAQLVAAELLYQRGLPPQAQYLFKHALIQAAAYQSVLTSTRRQYHQQIAQVLEARFPETVATHPELLAHHYTEAALSAPAVPYWQQAGDKAMARSAHREAVEYFEQALNALAHLPETRATRAQVIDLWIALRSALGPLGDFERILACLRKAEALAEALDDPCRLGQVYLFLAVHCYPAGAYDRVIATAQRVLALPTGGGESVLHALAHRYLGLAYKAQGDYRRAIDCLRYTVGSLDGARQREFFGQPNLPAVLAYAHLAVCHAEVGTFAEGRALGEEGLRIAEAVAHPGSLMFALWGVGLLCLRQGDLPRALPWLERALGICQEAGFPVYFPMMAAALGTAYTLNGRIADAVPLLTQAMAQTTAMETAAFQALCRFSLGEAQVLAGRLEEARALAEQALALARAHQERGHQAYALRLLGEITARSAAPAVEQAANHYRQALTLAQELGMRPLLAHCHRGLGTLYTTTGQWEQARAALSAAMDLYRAMDMLFWLPQVEAALAQVEGP